jgi:hypothetical protein
MKASSKGQVAIEFLMYAGLFMIIAIAAFVLTTFAERGDVGIRESQLLDAFGYRFASAPTIAYKGGEGLIYDISFSRQLDGRDYSITYICLDSGACSAQVSWTGSFSEYTYSYVIALEIPAPSEISNPEVRIARRLVPGLSSGHLIFRNTGFEAEESEYPVIELYCSYEGEEENP